MNKKDFIAAIAENAEVTKKDAEAVVKATFAVLEKAMADGDRVSITGFGTFEVRERKARTGKNPRTGATVKIAACKAPAFKASHVLKDAVNAPKKGKKK
jgi:DNA-binding protein HU-beta